MATRSAHAEDDDDPHGRPRNVVLVVLDTARASAVDERTMPALTRLAEDGTAFDRAFATAPWTVPSHASLFSGTYPTEHGTHGDHLALRDHVRTLAEAFADAGYDTVGVSNNTWITDEFGFDRGFDRLRRGWQYVQADTDMGGVVRGECLSEKVAAFRARVFDGNPLVNTANVLYSEFFQPTGDDGAARTTAWLADWFASREDRPFFCFCNYIEPHIPYTPPRTHADRFLPDDATVEEATAIRQDPRAYDCADYDITDREFRLLRGLYRAELAYVDDHLTALREALEAAGEWDRTLLVVCGDHGEHVGEHGFFGHQYNLYDSVLAIPLVFYGGPFVGGGHRDDLVQLIDVPDTLLETMGVDDPAFRDQSRGRSLHPASDDPPREAVVAEYAAPQPSIERLEARFGELPERVYAFDRRLRAIRTDRYKYVAGDDGFSRLHDLAADPTERLDRSAERPDLADQLAADLEARFSDVDPPDAAAAVAVSDATKARLAELGYR